jgi:hypothetical protein
MKKREETGNVQCVNGPYSILKYVFGIPMIASVALKENRPLENLQLEPDIKVQNDYNAVLNGEDQQIEAAVKEMLKEIKENQ